MYFTIISFFYSIVRSIFPRSPLQPSVFVCALEQSGDELAADLLSTMPQKGHWSFWGVAGKQLRKKGVTELLSTEIFSLMGFTDVLKRLPFLLHKYRYLRKTILQRNPAVCLLVDSPALHLRLAKGLRMRGYRGTIIQYVCPTVWLYKKKRAKDLSLYFDHVWGIFPFESFLVKTVPQLVALENPTLRRSKENIAKFSSTRQSQKDWITLFPGSRSSEIKLNLPLMVEAISKLKHYHPNLKIAVSLCSEQHHDRIVKLVCQNPLLREVSFFDQSENAQWMERSLFSIAVSGTISLELACMQVPHLCLYKVRKLNALIASFLINPLPRYFTLPNIIAQVHAAQLHCCAPEKALQYRIKSPLVKEVVGEKIDIEQILVWCWKALDPVMNEQMRSNLQKLPTYFSSAHSNDWARNELSKFLEGKDEAV